MFNLTCQVNDLLVKLTYIFRVIFLLHFLKTFRLINILLDSFSLLLVGRFVFTITGNVMIRFWFILRRSYDIWTERRSIFVSRGVLFFVVFYRIIFGRYLMPRYLVIRINIIMVLCSFDFFTDLLLSK